MSLYLFGQNLILMKFDNSGKFSQRLEFYINFFYILKLSKKSLCFVYMIFARQY